MSLFIRLSIGIGLIALVLWFEGGPQALWESLAQIGPSIILCAMASHATSMAICGVAWWSTAGRPAHPVVGFFVLTRWIRDGIGQLLPLIPLGGEVTGARILAHGGGLGGPQAAAVTVVDITVELMTQALYSMIGAVAWMFQDGSLTYAAISVAMILPLAAALFMAQKMGLVKVLESLADRVMPDHWKSEDLAPSIHTIIHSLYADFDRLKFSALIHMAAWLFATSECYLVLTLLHHPLTIAQCIALESVIYAVRSAAFMVPGALGLQEGGYVLVGAALGLPSETALALALVKRARELCLGIPALMVWQWVGVRKVEG